MTHFLTHYVLYWFFIAAGVFAVCVIFDNLRNFDADWAELRKERDDVQKWIDARKQLRDDAIFAQISPAQREGDE
jgi:hypothetical protein